MRTLLTLVLLSVVSGCRPSAPQPPAEPADDIEDAMDDEGPGNEDDDPPSTCRVAPAAAVALRR